MGWSLSTRHSSWHRREISWTTRPCAKSRSHCWLSRAPETSSPERAGSGRYAPPYPVVESGDGARLVYLYIEVRGTVYMLLAYAKNEQVDLSAAEKRTLRTLARQLEEGG